MLKTLLARLQLALKTTPTPSAWFYCGALCAACTLLAAALGFTSGFLKFESTSAPPGAFLLTALRIFFLPALVEEILFRILPIPHPTESAPTRHVVLAAVTSLIAFVAMHPANGFLFRTESRAVFTHPIFLAMAALLGAACTLAYRLTGSLWPPVLMHWLTVTVWTLFLGGKNMLIGVKTPL